MSELGRELLSIEYVDEAFIEELRRTAPPGIRVDHHKIATFSAGGPEWDVAAIYWVAEDMRTLAVGLIGSWLWSKIEAFKKRSEAVSKHVSVNHQPAHTLNEEQIRAILSRAWKK